MRADARAAAALALFLAALASAREVRAAAPPTAAIEQAKQAQADGDRLFQLSRFEDAIAAYERAFSLDPQPAFLVNIGLAHRRQFQIDGQIDHLLRARELYRNFLKLEPDSRSRPGIEKILADLDARIAELRRAPAAAVAPLPLVPAEAPPSGARAAPPPAASIEAPPRAVPAPPPPAALIEAPSGGPAPQPRRSSSRAWLIAGGAVAVAAGVAIVFVATRPRTPAFDGPGVDLTPR
jgi:tetratricopeptide (TPR) repeat protein